VDSGEIENFRWQSVRILSSGKIGGNKNFFAEGVKASKGRGVIPFKLIQTKE
jgi:hypothetical protein